MNIFIDKNYPKNGNNYSKETIKSIYNYIRPLNYFLFLDIKRIFKNGNQTVSYFSPSLCEKLLRDKSLTILSVLIKISLKSNITIT